MMENKKSIVIIGSGIGGLTCGAVLSKHGFKVTILEKNKQIGGNLQSFARDKHVFDSGVHYVGGLDKGQNLYRIFKYLGFVDKLKLEKLEENAFDKIVFYDDFKDYDYAQGYEKFMVSLIKDFPDEEVAIKTYCETIKSICENFPLYNLREGGYTQNFPFLEVDTKTYIESITKNRRLQNVLAGNNPLYAGYPDKTPLYVHSLVLNSYIESSYRIVDGGGQIAKFLSKVILENGGKLIKHKEVTKIVSSDNNVGYVLCSDGSQYAADYFISNMHPAKTMEITDSELIRPAYRNRIASLENSTSAFIINIRLKPDMFKYQKCNYYCYMNDDVWDTMNYTEETWPLGYALFYSGTKKDLEYAEGITIMGYMKIEEVEQWKNTYNTAGKPAFRGIDYENFKRRKAEKLIDCVEQKFPGLKAAILNYYTATPLTFRDYMGTDDGSIYGITKDYQNPLKTFISPHTKIKNLFLTGQNINLHGVLGVSISSLVTCSALINISDILKNIEDAQND